MSQTTRIKKYLEKGGTLTHRKAEKMFNCDRLAAMIEELRLRDIEIITTMVKRNGKRFAEYRRG